MCVSHMKWSRAMSTFGMRSLRYDITCLKKVGSVSQSVRIITLVDEKFEEEKKIYKCNCVK